MRLIFRSPLLEATPKQDQSVLSERRKGIRIKTVRHSDLAPDQLLAAAAYRQLLVQPLRLQPHTNTNPKSGAAPAVLLTVFETDKVRHIRK